MYYLLKDGNIVNGELIPDKLMIKVKTDKGYVFIEIEQIAKPLEVKQDENKYQEALDYLVVNSLGLLINQGNKDTELMDWHYESRDLLQELVDKEKPMKPTVKELKRPDGKGGEEFWQYLYKCPTCEENYKKNRFINHFNSLDKGIPYCKHCGQKLDWSEIDD